MSGDDFFQVDTELEQECEIAQEVAIDEQEQDDELKLAEPDKFIGRDDVVKFAKDKMAADGESSDDLNEQKILDSWDLWLGNIAKDYHHPYPQAKRKRYNADTDKYETDKDFKAVEPRVAEGIFKFLTPAALEQIIKFRGKFSYGLDFDHLPAGFRLVKSKPDDDNSPVDSLDYDPLLAARKPNPSPFSLKLTDNAEDKDARETAEQRIASYEGVKKKWWDSLYAQHKVHNPDDHLKPLVQAFDCFVESLQKQYGLKISDFDFDPKKQLQEIKNMQVALGRMATIMQAAQKQDKKTQLQDIPSLDLSSTGAIRAVLDTRMDEAPCNVVLAAMKCVTSEYDLGKLSESSVEVGTVIVDGGGKALKLGNCTSFGSVVPADAKEGDKYTIQCCGDDGGDVVTGYFNSYGFDGSGHYFWRKLAREERRYSIEFYRKALSIIEEEVGDTDFTDKTKAKKILISMLYEMTTGALYDENFTGSKEQELLNKWRELLKLYKDFSFSSFMMKGLVKIVEKAMKIKFIEMLLEEVRTNVSLANQLDRFKIELDFAREVSLTSPKQLMRLNDVFHSVNKIEYELKNAAYRGLRFFHDIYGMSDKKDINGCILKKYSDVYSAMPEYKKYLIKLISTFDIDLDCTDEAKELSQYVASLAENYGSQKIMEFCLGVFDQVENNKGLSLKDLKSFLSQVFTDDNKMFLASSMENLDIKIRKISSEIRNRKKGFYYGSEDYSSFVDENAKWYYSEEEEKFLAKFQDPAVIAKLEKDLKELEDLKKNGIKEARVLILKAIKEKFSANFAKGYLDQKIKEAQSPTIALSKSELSIVKSYEQSLHKPLTELLENITCDDYTERRKEILKLLARANNVLLPDDFESLCKGLSVIAKTDDDTYNSEDNHIVTILKEVCTKGHINYFAQLYNHPDYINSSRHAEKMAVYMKELAPWVSYTKTEFSRVQLQTVVSNLVIKQESFVDDAKDKCDKLKLAIEALSKLAKKIPLAKNYLLESLRELNTDSDSICLIDTVFNYVKRLELTITGECWLDKKAAEAEVKAKEAKEAQDKAKAAQEAKKKAKEDAMAAVISEEGEPKDAAESSSTTSSHADDVKLPDTASVASSDTSDISDISESDDDDSVASESSKSSVAHEIKDSLLVSDTVLHSILYHLHKEPNKLFNILNKLNLTFDKDANKTTKVTDVLSIISKLLDNKKSIENLDGFIGQLKEANDDYYQDIMACYKTSPYPDVPTIVEWINSGDFKAKQKQFSIRPFYREAAYGFDVDKYRAQRQLFPVKQQKVLSDKLAADFAKYTGPNGSLAKLTSEQLSDSVKHLQAEYIKNPNNQDTKSKLLFHAVEMLARTASQKDPFKKGRIISQELNATQLMAVYTMLFSGDDKISCQIETGEGKSRIMVVAAAVKALMGKTVDLVTSNMALSERDYTIYKSYFKALGIETGLIFADSSQSAYKQGGVNFSDSAQLNLARNRAAVKHLSKGGFAAPKEDSVLLLDEADLTYFDVIHNRYNYAEQDKAMLDIAWLYENLVVFADKNKADLEKHDEFNKKHFAEFLKLVKDREYDEGRITYVQKLVESEQGQKKLSTWFKAALAAANMQEDVHFKVSSADKDKLIPTVTPKGIVYTRLIHVISGNRVARSSKYANGVHQCLAARMNLKAREQDATLISDPFYIQPEKQIAYSSTAKTLLDRYDQICGVSGTLGAKSERSESHAKYGMQFVNIPRHSGFNRRDQKMLVAKDYTHQIELIKDQVRAARKAGRPILIICESDAKSLKYFNDILAITHDKSKIQYVHADSTTTEEEEAVANAGKPGMVTVSTNMLGRGTDINSSNLLVIPTYIPSTRDMGQICGRAGRFGQRGESRLILNRQDSDLPLTYLHGKQLLVMQARNEQSFQVKRLINEAMSDFRDQLQHQFFVENYDAAKLGEWQAMLKELSSNWDLEQKVLLKEFNTSQNVTKVKTEFDKFVADWKENFSKFIIDADAIKVKLNLDLVQKVKGHKKVSIRAQASYDIADDGQACVYKGLFKQTRAILTFDRKIFANTRAWWNGQGVLFADTIAMFKGERLPFANTIATIKTYKLGTTFVVLATVATAAAVGMFLFYLMPLAPPVLVPLITLAKCIPMILNPVVAGGITAGAGAAALVTSTAVTSIAVNLYELIKKPEPETNTNIEATVCRPECS